MPRLILFVFLGLLFTGCRKELSVENGDMGEIRLSFSAAVKTSPLNPGQEYTNAWGEKYTVSTFKYYIHDIAFLNAAGMTLAKSSEYYLVDDANTESKTITVRAPAGEYKRITFMLGVDSARNVSGAQTGVHDPTNGMFWTWSSGYVMAKLEGTSASAATPSGNFSYHVGGFKQPDLAIKRIVLDVPVSSRLQVLQASSATVDIQADINTWFGNVHPIRITENPACHSPGTLARQIADNYAGMFSISGVR